MGYLGSIAGPLSVASTPEPSTELWSWDTLGYMGGTCSPWASLCAWIQSEGSLVASVPPWSHLEGSLQNLGDPGLGQVSGRVGTGPLTLDPLPLAGAVGPVGTCGRTGG